MQVYVALDYMTPMDYKKYRLAVKKTVTNSAADEYMSIHNR